MSKPIAFIVAAGDSIGSEVAKKFARGVTLRVWPGVMVKNSRSGRMDLRRTVEQLFTNSEFNKYLVAGFTAFLVDYCLLLIATEWFGIHYLVSNICSYMAGLLVAYTLNIRWVFRYRKYEQRSKQEFSIFVLIVLMGLGISEGIIFLLVEQVALPYHYAKIVSVGTIFVFNFIAKKHFLFSRESADG